MFGSECDLKMYVQNLGYPLLLKTRGTNTISQFNGKFNVGYVEYLRNKTWQSWKRHWKRPKTS